MPEAFNNATERTLMMLGEDRELAVSCCCIKAVRSVTSERAAEATTSTTVDCGSGRESIGNSSR